MAFCRVAGNKRHCMGWGLAGIPMMFISNDCEIILKPDGASQNSHFDVVK